MALMLHLRPYVLWPADDPGWQLYMFALAGRNSPRALSKQSPRAIPTVFVKPLWHLTAQHGPLERCTHTGPGIVCFM